VSAALGTPRSPSSLTCFLGLMQCVYSDDEAAMIEIGPGLCVQEIRLSARAY
jgi:hypothetical protein